MKTTQVSALNRRETVISMESILIFAICSMDLLSTLWLLAAGLAAEANPLMAYLLKHGTAAFCAVKMSTVICLIAVTEWYKKYNPRFVRNIMRITIAAYLTIYAILVSTINLA